MTPPVPDSRIRIGLFLGGTGSDGGTYQYALSLLTALSKLPSDRYEVFGFCVRAEWIPRCEVLGVTAVRVPDHTLPSRLAARLIRPFVPHPLSKRLMSRVVPFGRMLKRMDIALCVYPNFEHYSFELDTPSVGAIHDLMHIHEPSFPEVSEGSIPRRRDHLFSRIYRGSTITVVDSQIGKQHVVDAYGGDGSSIEVMPYPVPPYILEACHDGEEAVAAVLDGLPPRYFFYPAQFWPHKNHVRLLEALDRVRQAHPDAHLVLAGSPKIGYEAVSEAIARLGLDRHVTLLGYVSDQTIACLYRGAVALVYPCIFGPTGIPPIEAQAAGCPVAVSRIYAMPEQLGEGALYFDPLSVEEMADCMERLWIDEDLRALLIERGSANVSRYLPESFAERFERLVERAVSVAREQ